MIYVKTCAFWLAVLSIATILECVHDDKPNTIPKHLQHGPIRELVPDKYPYVPTDYWEEDEPEPFDT